MQQRKSNRYVWKHQVDLQQRSIQKHTGNPNCFSRLGGNCHDYSPEAPSVSVTLRETMQIPCEMRNQVEIRIIKKWLCGIKYFIDSGIPEGALYDVARYIAYRSYRPGDFIFRQGDIGDYFYIVISGRVSIAGYGAGLFATMYPGMCFGEISLFKEGSGQRSASANVNFDTPFTELGLINKVLFSYTTNFFRHVTYTTCIRTCAIEVLLLTSRQYF